MYKPLPESLTIKQSGINGLGLFADQDIKRATNLGMSHLKIKDTLWSGLHSVDSLIMLVTRLTVTKGRIAHDE